MSAVIRCKPRWPPSDPDADPDLVRVACPHCGHLVNVSGQAMVSKAFASMRWTEGEAQLEDKVRRAFDSEGKGWYVRCRRCGQPYRLVFGVQETHSMSGWFVAGPVELIYFDSGP